MIKNKAGNIFKHMLLAISQQNYYQKVLTLSNATKKSFSQNFKTKTIGAKELRSRTMHLFIWHKFDRFLIIRFTIIQIFIRNKTGYIF